VRGSRREFVDAWLAASVRTAPTATTRDQRRRPVDDRSDAVSLATSRRPRPAPAQPPRPGTLDLLLRARFSRRPVTTPGQGHLQSPPNHAVRPTISCLIYADSISGRFIKLDILCYMYIEYLIELNNTVSGNIHKRPKNHLPQRELPFRDNDTALYGQKH